MQGDRVVERSCETDLDRPLENACNGIERGLAHGPGTLSCPFFREVNEEVEMGLREFEILMDCSVELVELFDNAGCVDGAVRDWVVAIPDVPRCEIEGECLQNAKDMG